MKDLIELLDVVKGGSVTLTVNGRPMISLDKNSKSFDIEVLGLKESSLKISGLLKAQKRGQKIIISSDLARRFLDNGWSFTLYHSGEKILTMSQGISRLTGHIRFNPINLKKILEAF